MLNIRVIGWSANTDQTIAELVEAESWQAAVRECCSKYAGELQFVVALNEAMATAESGFTPVGRWETMPLKPDGWQKFRGKNEVFSIMGFDHRALLPVLEHWNAPNWTMAAQKSLTQQRHAEYRFIAAFSGIVNDAAILGFFTADLIKALDPVELPTLERFAK
tara:strand:+ start:7525 stop:8013 length:489 start_codon:yes stop_codon:yes gene_type:complete